MKKVVVITGGSSGIGLATAKMLFQQGYSVYSLALTNCPDERIKSIVCNVTDDTSIQNAFQTIYKETKHIDIVVNCAGMGISGAIEHTDITKIEKQFDVNLLGTIKVCRCAIAYLKHGEDAKIINIGSVASEIPIPFQACYSASKAAIENFSLALNLELKTFKIQVCTVLPGDTSTGFTAAREKCDTAEGYDDRIKKSVAKMEKDEKNGRPPESVAKVILKQIKKRKMKLVVAVGFEYKLILFLEKILPKRLMLYIVGKIYG